MRTLCEIVFDSKECLIRQIECDKKAIREILAELRQ